MLHGFTGSPFEVEPLADYLRQHTDWYIHVPTLPGHGDLSELRDIQYDEWNTFAEDAVKEMLAVCEEVYVIGFSMGGIIAGYLTAKYPIKKLVLLSAAAKYINIGQLARDMGGLLKDYLNGNASENEMYKRYKEKIVKTPLKATWQFRSLVSANTKLLKEIHVPVFIAQGRLDGIVPVKSAAFLYRNIPSPDKVLFYDDEAKHLICHSRNNMILFKEILAFLEKEDETVARGAELPSLQ